MAFKQRHSRHGFTLVEVTLVLAVGGVLLVGVASLVFGLMQLKIAADTAPQEDEHRANLVRFMEYIFAQAEPVKNAGDEGEAASSPVEWREVPGSSDLNAKALAFRLPGNIPVFVDDEIYMPAVDCYLRLIDDEGLFLFWQTDEMADENIEDFRRTLISPIVTQLEYLWYDEEDEVWDSSDEAEENDEGEFVIPQFIRLTFRGGDEDNPRTAMLLLPPDDPAIPRL
ncbi:MAG: PulJ/GspJ family protein [Puniceicoccales bacterium]